MKKIIEKTCWTIDDPELPGSVKQRILEKHADFNVDHDWWEFPYCYFPPFVESPKIEAFDLWYRQYCQWVGEINTELAYQFWRKKHLGANPPIILNKTKNFFCPTYAPGLFFDIRPEKKSGWRERNTILELYFPDFGSSYDTIQTPTQSEILELMAENGERCNEWGLKRDWASIAAEITQFVAWVTAQVEPLPLLRDDYNYKTSEEAIIEGLRVNEYFFDEEGKIC